MRCGWGYREYFTFYSEFGRPHRWLPILEAVCVILLALVALVGNILVIIIIVWQRALRTVTNAFIANLAVCGILFVLGFPIIVLTRLRETWVFGEGVCKLLFFVQNYSAVASVWTLGLISYDRYKWVVRSGVGALKMRTAIIIIMLKTLLGLGLFTPIAIHFIVLELPLNNRTVKICTLVWPNSPVRPSILYTSLMGTFFIFIPFILITFFYSKIFQVLKRSRNNLMSYGSLSSDSDGTMRPIPSKSTGTGRTRRDRKIITMLVTVVVVFVVSWIPMFLVFVLMLYDGLSQALIVRSHYFLLAICIAFTNACINPIIYGVMNTNFTSALHALFGKCLRRTDRNSKKVDGVHRPVPLRFDIQTISANLHDNDNIDYTSL